MLRILLALFYVIVPFGVQANTPVIADCKLLDGHTEAYVYCAEGVVCETGVAVEYKDCKFVYKTDLNWSNVFSEISNRNYILSSGAGTYNIKIDTIPWATKFSTSTDCMWNFLNHDLQKENPDLLGSFCRSYDRFLDKEELYRNLLNEKARRNEPNPPQDSLINIKFLSPILLGVALILFGILKLWKRR